jgi:cell division protein FtsB
MGFLRRVKSIKVNHLRILMVVGIVVLVFLMLDFNNRMTELQRLSSDRDRLTTRVVQLTETIQDLNTEIAYATSDLAVDQWAREEGKMIKTGDVPIVPVSPDQVTPQPTQAPQAAPHVVNNWDIWYALFLGQY